MAFQMSDETLPFLRARTGASKDMPTILFQLFVVDSAITSRFGSKIFNLELRPLKTSTTVDATRSRSNREFSHEHKRMER